MALDDPRLRTIATELVAVPGVIGVLLGGSRARGEHRADSDVDLGLYYRGSRARVDIASLRDLAGRLSGREIDVTEHGGWGPWVDGGGWLDLDGVAVDWIYRDLDRVEDCWAGAVAGRHAFHVQAGHPLGVPELAYPGEVALGRVLADPTGVLTELRERYRRYPPALTRAVVAGLWEAGFILGGARKGASRGDATYVAGCLFRALGLCAHALHAHAGRWLVNEKGAIEAAGRLPGAPPDFATRAHHLFGEVGPRGLAAAIDRAEVLLAQVRDAVGPAATGDADTVSR
ncbi:nucleotidyltransferase domain-containing protein [Occultella glacieicola]|uniref:Nucleotidyltransferase domain-containing protein n=1 Tax=Occultella glacieicola TaxID=2518684 RepID=A0ABY2E2W3_9MICO|nr:nucleotidyltransferase domain-containing protein [Occultella glacieicola]TDE93954.1 nucleotidyltransferase domain-containing protein [Occultella glacieicola]